jgi:hypothetical protein
MLSSLHRCGCFLVSASLLLTQSCAERDAGCHTSGDCDPGARCVEARCVPASTASPPQPIEAQAPGCEGAQAPDRRDLVLHEILAAVPTDPALGDTNGDGRRDAAEDEFIELVNLSGGAVLTRGLRLFKGDAEAPFAELQAACLPPGGALVVLGGLRADAAPPALGGALVEVAQKPMRLPDGGGELRVETAQGKVLFAGAYPAASEGSVTLWPERVSHQGFVPHVEVSPLRSSPGTCADGRPFASGCPPRQPPCPGARPPAQGDLWLSEALTAVPSGPEGDANGDGVTSAARDEFLEILNLAQAPLRVEGLRLFKEEREVSALRLPCLQPGEALVWLAGLEGGAAAPSWPGAQVEVSPKTWSLRQGGGRLRLEGADGALIWEEALPAATRGSLARAPGGAWVGHPELADGALMSPGRCPDGRPLGTRCAAEGPPDPCLEAPAPRPGELLLHEVLARPAPGLDADGDGEVSATADEFVEIVSVAGSLRRVEGVVLTVNGEVKHRLRGCLEPLDGLVIHSGEGPLARPRHVRAERALRLGNAGGTLHLLGAPNGEILAILAYDEAPARSLQMWPELDPEGDYLPHPDPGMSPGACADGTPWEGLCPQ